MENELKEQIDLLTTEDILSNNVFEFKYKDKEYRVNKPTFKNKQEVFRKKAEKFNEFIQNKNIVLEKDLIAIYKERGINVEDIDKAINTLEKSKNSYKEKLGESLTKGLPESDLVIFKKEIEQIIDKQMEFYNQRYALFQYSLESQLRLFAYTYISIFMVEEKVDNKWIQLWKTYEDYEACSDENFISIVSVYIGTLLKNESL